MSFLSIQGETPRSITASTHRIRSSRVSRSKSTTPFNSSRAPKSNYNTHSDLFAILRKLCKSAMITPLDFVERTNPSLNDPNMFNIHSAVLEQDPLNPPTITSNALWKLVKERSGVDPPSWQKIAAFNKLDDRRTGTISFARLCCGAALFDPGYSTKLELNSINENTAVTKWIETSANDMLKSLQTKLKSKHKTDSPFKLFAHFARACNPSMKVEDDGPTDAKHREQYSHIRINHQNFIRGLKAYNVMNVKKSSSHEAAKKLFKSFDYENKGFFTSQTFINQGLNDGAQGLGNEVGQYSPAGRRASQLKENQKKNTRMKQANQMREQLGNTITPKQFIEMLRSTIQSKMVGYSNLEGYRIFKNACGNNDASKGSFTLKTFVKGCEGLGLDNLPMKTLSLVFNALDLDNDGYVDYHEFIHILTLEGHDKIQEDIVELSQGRSRLTDRSTSLPLLYTGRRSKETDRNSIMSSSNQTIRSNQSNQSSKKGNNNNNNNNNDNNTSDNLTIHSEVFKRWKQMLKLFVAVDRKNKGELGRKEFADVLSRFGIQTKDNEEFNELFDKYDLDGNGTIHYKEFLSQITGKNDDELSFAFDKINIDSIDMRHAKIRNKDIFTNSIHLDPDINSLLNDGGNTFHKNEPGYYNHTDDDHGNGSINYDQQLITPIINALKKNEILNGIVSLRKMVKIMLWHGIDMTKIDINESNTIEIRSNRYPNTPIISSEGKKLTTTRTKIGIKYRPLLRKIFRTNV